MKFCIEIIYIVYKFFDFEMFYLKFSNCFRCIKVLYSFNSIFHNPLKKKKDTNLCKHIFSLQRHQVKRLIFSPYSLILIFLCYLLLKFSGMYESLIAASKYT